MNKTGIKKQIEYLEKKYQDTCEACGEFSLQAEKIDQEIIRLDEELASSYSAKKVNEKLKSQPNYPRYK